MSTPPGPSGAYHACHVPVRVPGGNRTLARTSGATRIDPFPGTFPPEDTGSDGLSVCKVAKQAGLISRYEHAFSLDAALTALQSGPVLVGITWKAGCDHPMSDGLVHWTGSVRGGHEIVADEIDVERKRVGFTNSWGPGWSLGGRFFLTWDDLGAALDASGDVTVPIL